MWLAILLVFIAASVVLHLYVYTRLYSYKGLDKFPSPPFLPFFGQCLTFMDVIKDYKNAFNSIQKLQRKYGGHFLIWKFPVEPSIVTKDLTTIEYLLSSSKHITKGDDYQMLEPWLGNGLLFSTGEKWHKRRKILTSAFHFEILEQYHKVMKRNADILVEKLAEYRQDEDVELMPLLGPCALDIICETTMGTKINAQTDRTNEYLNSVKIVFNLLTEKFFTPWLQGDLYKFTKRYRQQQKEIEKMQKFTRSVIEKRRQQLIAEISNSNSNEELLSSTKLTEPWSVDSENDNIKIIKSNRKPFLDILLQTRLDGETLSDKDIREEVDTFMFEGHDTVSSTLSFVLHEITKRKEVQDKIYEEISQTFKKLQNLTSNDNTNDDNNRITGSCSFEPDIAVYRKLTYLDTVIKETLRLYPPVPFIMRHLKEDVTIDNGSDTIFIPKGVDIAMNFYALHRDPQIHPDPDEFVPERHNNNHFVEDCNKHRCEKSPFSYVPFSAGLRNCIGQKFAMLELKTILSKILLNFELTNCKPDENLDLYFMATLKTSKGPVVRLKKRM